MKLSTITTSWAFAQAAVAHPGASRMRETFAEIKRQSRDSLDSKELIGDLLTLDDSQLTSVGKDIKKVLQGGDGETSVTWSYRIPQKDTEQCRQDTCCIWQYISDELRDAFKGESGRCNSLARGAVRLGFHDAAGWSKGTGDRGGADGSIILNDIEMARPDNRGLEEIVAQMKVWYEKYKGYGVGAGDLIQMAANVATVVCPLGPRIKTYVGRIDSSAPAPDGLLPNVFDSADNLIKLFQNKTIEPHGLTALIGAHTTSQQRFVDTSRANDPQDSTPGVWDVAFYKETLGSAPRRVFRFASDIALAKDPRISDEFKEFAGNGGQRHWDEDYAREYVRLSLLGVFNINNLADCSKVLPPHIGSFRSPDESPIRDWLDTLGPSPIGELLQKGSIIGGVKTIIGGLLGGLGGLFGKLFGGRLFG